LFLRREFHRLNRALFMTDYFRLLDLPRRPWLDPEAVKQQFLARTSAAHPDRVHAATAEEKAGANQAFAELNAAHRCLAEPKLRLLHLLELERGAKPADIRAIPGQLADLFAAVATRCRETDAFLAEKARATSPLLQVALFERAQEWLEKLDGLQNQLAALHTGWLAQLQDLDSRWVSAAGPERDGLLTALEELYRLFGYHNRWQAQLAERRFALMS
jgi:DnaJ-domain-containing protein 1